MFARLMVLDITNTVLGEPIAEARPRSREEELTQTPTLAKRDPFFLAHRICAADGTLLAIISPIITCCDSARCGAILGGELSSSALFR